MRRTWGIATLVCPRCAGPMRLIATIEDPRTAARILAHLGFPTRAPPPRRPWRGRSALALERRAEEYSIDPLPADE